MRSSGIFLTFALAVFPAFGSAPTEVVPGEREFQRNCASCHFGGRVGPALSRELVNGHESAVRSKILEGGGQMPGFKLMLTDRDVSLILTYLKGRETAPTLLGARSVAP